MVPTGHPLIQRLAEMVVLLGTPVDAGRILMPHFGRMGGCAKAGRAAIDHEYRAGALDIAYVFIRRPDGKIGLGTVTVIPSRERVSEQVPVSLLPGIPESPCVKC